jgi:hypothetical protein
MRAVIGGLMAGVILYFVPGGHSGPACLIAGILMALLLIQLGPRSHVERIAALETAAVLAWSAGPSAYHPVGLFRYLFGWLLAGSALSFYLRPKSE